MKNITTHSLVKSIVYFLIVGILFSCHTKHAVQQAETYIDKIAQHRIQYKADFLADERAPLQEEDFENMHFYPADEQYDCACTFTRTPDANPFEMSTVSGNVQIFTKYGIASCPINNELVKVNIYASKRTQSMPGYKDHLFIPFRDLTSGESTYGGGRYIDLKTGDIKNNRVAIDFNKCYNPWCMYSDGYNCPIPPTENHLAVSIEAGEKTWTGEKKHK